MSTITLTLPDETVAALTSEARERGVAVEELLERLAADYLARGRTASDAAFQRAKSDTFREHAELYRRLAK